MNKLFGFLFFAASCFPSWAAEIYSESSKKSHFLFLEGVIRDGDAEKLAKEMSKLPRVDSFWLSSPGGSIVESLKIAKLVDVSSISTDIKYRSDCVSACFFIWLAGLSRVAEGVDGAGGSEPPKIRSDEWMRFVGIHRPYVIDKDLVSSGFMKSQVSAMDYVRSYLSEGRVPLYLIDEMMARPSNQIYWLRDRDLDAIGKYRPEVEELLIRECGYERDYGWKYRSNPTKKYSIMKCEASVLVRHFEEGQVGVINKLKSGWRPW